MLTFDWTINITGLIGIITFAGGGLWAAFTVQSDIRELKKEAGATRGEIGGLTRAVTAIALTDARMDALGRRLDDEKEEGQEYRHAQRNEIARMWGLVGELQKASLQLAGQLAGALQALAALQAKN